MKNLKRWVQKELGVWGAIFLFCSLSFASRVAIPFDLLALSIGGFLLSAKLQIRGFCYALILLALATIVKHAFFIEDHLWQLGIEGSIGLAFLITALAFEQNGLTLQSLKTQLQTQSDAFANLEEELAKVQESAQNQQIIFQEKVESLQKELEETQTEYASILILNEVLRKTTARHIQEADRAGFALVSAKASIEQLKAECEVHEQEIKRIKNGDALNIENRELLKELNRARFDKEQTHLINETLARLHLREALKAKDAVQEISSLKVLLHATHEEVGRVAAPLEEKLKAAKQEIEALKFEFEKSQTLTDQARRELMKLQEIHTERNFLKERLDAAMLELSARQSTTDPELVEKLKFAEEKMFHLSQIEPLFKQLKKQFDEKNQVLHETRSDLFKSDTELQRLKIEKAALDLNPIPKEIEEELTSLASQVESLEEENRELQELITTLSGSTERKKKVKTQPLSSEQTLLF